MRHKPVPFFKLKFSALIFSAVLLAMTTFVLGAAPMRVARVVYGRWPFWGAFMLAAAAVAAAGLPAYALLIFSLVVMIGVYTDLEEHGHSTFASGLVGLIASIGSTALCGGLWLYEAKIHLLEEIRALIASFDPSVLSSNPAFAINPETFIQQLPSAAVIALMMALCLALVSERRIMYWIGYSKSIGPVIETRLSSFRAPDIFVWLTIVAISGAFIKHGKESLEIVSVNVLNILVVLFFFQGLAIVSQAFRTFKVNAFWQGLWYVLLVFQLFFLVSLVGFADFWLEFRARLTRKPAATNKGF